MGKIGSNKGCSHEEEFVGLDQDATEANEIQK